MRRVLHVGPCNTPGGMAKVIEILSQNPPEGWIAETLNSHIISNHIAKYLHHRKMLKNFVRMIRSEKKPHVVHIHTAADWSWKRKSRYIAFCEKYAIPCIVHIHSGKFGDWLGEKHSRRSRNFRKITNFSRCKIVVLTDGWQQRLSEQIGDCLVVNNPVDPKLIFDGEKEFKNQLLMLGRYDSVKGHNFAMRLLEKLRCDYDDKLTLVMTGTSKLEAEGLFCYQWVTEPEKLQLIQESRILVIPSKFEGQPLVMLEGLYCGLPCLASDKIIDLPDTVVSAKYNHLNDWCDKVIQILDNPVDRHHIHESVKHLGIKSINKNWFDIYRSLID